MKKEKTVSRLIKEYGIIIALVLLSAFFGVMKPKFLTASNFLTILKQTSVVAICSVGMLFVLITAGINLSVGYMMAALV